jgi:gliding motility-associated protein GldE
LETDYFLNYSILSIINSIEINEILELILMLILISISALISGSEVAYFSLKPSVLSKMKKAKSGNSHRIIKLLNHPEKLLATILITNNIINVGIVILSSTLSDQIFNFGDRKVAEMIFKVIVITFILLLFGEVIPKVYASRFDKKFAKFMALPLIFLNSLLSPLSRVLISSSSIIQKRIKNNSNISINELSDALELTQDDELMEEEKILKGIVNFGSINTSAIMKPRVDVTSVDIKDDFKTILDTIIDKGYSRIPVQNKSLDKIKGILYAKDLLPHIHKTVFRWQSLIRPPYFVPETKKINDLLSEFQSQKNHIAIVIDEYGGSCGIVTLEDVLEEIVGEISDEFDEEEKIYKKISENEYEFEGKVLLQDFYKIINIDEDIFEDIKGDADTLAGLILEIKGEIPEENDGLKYRNLVFKIKSVDNRRIKTIYCKVN